MCWFERNTPNKNQKKWTLLNQIPFNIEKSNSFIATKSSLIGTFYVTQKTQLIQYLHLYINRVALTTSCRNVIVLYM